MKTVWDTTLIPQNQRTEFWRSAVCEAFLSMTPRIDRAQDFAARLDHLSMDGIDMNQVVAPAHGVSRGVSDIARGSKDVFFLNMCTNGRCHVRQGGREHTAQAHELVLIDSTAPYAVDLPDGGVLFSLSLPIQRLLPMVPNAHDRTAISLRSTTASRMLQSHVQQVAALGDITEGQAALVGQIFLSLAAGCLAEVPVREKSIRHRLARLRKLIAIHYDDPAFSPTLAARLAGISLRSLHAEFGRVGSSFAAELYEFRLRRARELLIQHGKSLPVATVGQLCGFRSAEHFCRKFRHRFDTTPSRCAKTFGDLALPRND